jgi:hypothetical protein
MAKKFRSVHVRKKLGYNMGMKPDTRNVVATFAGIAFVLTGSFYVHRTFTAIDRMYLVRDEEVTRRLTERDEQVVALERELEVYRAQQADLELQLADALEAVGNKQAADALRAQEEADRVAQEERAAKAAATASAEQAASEAQAVKEAQVAADAKAKAEATARAKALADAQALAKAQADAEAAAAAEKAAQENAQKPSRRTRAS